VFCDVRKQNPQVELIPPKHSVGGRAFRLWHTFSSESDFYMPEGSSDNLMDYKETATRLHKYQWDYIHDPEGGLYLFQDEEEGAAQLIPDLVCTQKFIERFRRAYVKNIKLIYESDVFPYAGHYAKDVSLGGEVYERIHISVHKNLDFTPIKIDYQNNYYRSDWEYGAGLTISSNDKPQKFSSYLFPNASDWSNQLDKIVKDINPDIEKNKLLDILSIIPYQEYTRLSNQQIKTAIKRINELVFMTEDRITCINDEEIILKIINSCENNFEKQKSLIIALSYGNVLNRIIKHLDGDNKKIFILKIAKYLKNVLPPDLNEINREYFNFNGRIYTKVFDWKETMGADVMFTSDNVVTTGEFRISTKKDILSIFQEKEYLMKLDAFEYVSLSAGDAGDYLPAGYSSDKSVILMPAFLFHYVVNEKHFEQVLKDFSTLADIGITVATLGSYTAGKTAVNVATKSVQGALIDFGIQAFINTLDGTSWEDAVAEVDYGNVMWATATIHIDNSKASYTLNCIRQAAQGALDLSNNNIREALLKGGKDCILDAFLSYFSRGIVNMNDNISSLIIKKLKISPKYVTKQLLKIGIHKETIQLFKQKITEENIKELIDKSIEEYYE
jgi:hypothetical protein